MSFFKDPDIKKLEKKRKVGKLIKVLLHPNKTVASAAAYALGKICDEVYSIEIIENLAKLKLTKLLETLFAFNKRKINLTKVELEAPGRELH